MSVKTRIFDNHTYAWEVLPEIGDFIRSLGPLLPENEYRKIGTDIWVHKSAKVAPTIMMAGPMIICEGANVRHSAFLRGNVIIGAGAVVGNSCELKTKHRSHTLTMLVILYLDIRLIWAQAQLLPM